MSTTAAHCEDCEATEVRIIFCSGCNFNQCEECWNQRIQHRKKLPGPGGIPHDQIDPQKVADLKACLAVPDSEELQKEQHLQDEDTTWFGVARDPSDGQPIFQDHGRYASIMAQSVRDSGAPRYPKIVSFVGETGAGKSTLIKLLIDLKRPLPTTRLSSLSTPVVGKESGDMATSADVHLYSDPATFSRDRPILYADCEGFNAGERSPVAASMVYQALQQTTSGTSSFTKPKLEGLSPLRKLANSSKRLLEWARREAPNYEKTSKREYAVTELYPRILYAFSDVIVFVLRNARTLESVVEQLLHWAHASYERSMNQPSKPHAVIALNASELPSGDVEWDEAHATASLLDSASAEIEKNSTFKHYVAIWRARGKDIWGMKDLLQCYYGTVHVVRLPNKTRLALLDAQRHLLHKVIDRGCANSHLTKERCQMLPDADDLQTYLQLAYDHFSRSLDKPFDFVIASLRINPIPVSFTNNITKLGSEICDRYITKLTRDTPDQHSIRPKIESIFDRLTNMVASCIMLDAARNGLMGRPTEWFDSEADQKSQSYRSVCKSSVEKYCTFFAQCEDWTKQGILSQTVHHCVKRKHLHEYEHRSAGNVLQQAVWYGEYHTAYNTAEHAWDQQVRTALIEIESSFDSRSPIERRRQAVRKHLLVVRNFYVNMGSANRYHSHSICLCCLREPAEHGLPCGHILCNKCAMDFGRLDGEMQVFMDICPLHEDLNWRSPQFLMKLKPAFSGLRLLSLDGGGIRGIVELEILKAIETELGKPLGICQFFDLVVGTSTGGIIAIGLGTKGWSVDKCIEEFLSLTRKAFVRRTGQELPVIKQLHLIVRHSSYTSTGIRTALQEAFGERTRFFGHTSDGQSSHIRVAVTTTSTTGDRAYIICNYNRRKSAKAPPAKDCEYTLHRPYDPAEEVLLWEAARMTSAAPAFFKPCKIVRDKETLKEYVDGGVLYNNPVSIAHMEGKLLSAEHGNNETADLILSLGTGKARREIGSSVSSSKPERRRAWLGAMLKLVKYQIEINLDSERTWQRFAKQEASDKDRIFRINPDLGYDPPLLDDVDAMSQLQTTTKGLMVDERYSSTVREVACCLIASSFYFHRSSVPLTESGGVVNLPGTLKCRFADGCDELKAVGLFIRSHAVVPPTFVVHGAALVEYHISCEGMIRDGVFATELQSVSTRGGDTQVSIALSLPGAVKDRQEFPISGFPRALMQMDFQSK